MGNSHQECTKFWLYFFGIDFMESCTMPIHFTLFNLKHIQDSGLTSFLGLIQTVGKILETLSLSAEISFKFSHFDIGFKIRSLMISMKKVLYEKIEGTATRRSWRTTTNSVCTAIVVKINYETQRWWKASFLVFRTNQTGHLERARRKMHSQWNLHIHLWKLLLL